MCPLWPRLQTLCGMCQPCPSCVRLMSALASSPNLGRHVSVRPCARLALYSPCVGFGRASKRCVPHAALCVRPLSFLCSLVVRPLSALCRPLSGSMVFGFGRAFVHSVSVLWFLRLFCSVSVVCPLFVWSPLAGSALVCLKASPRICALSFVLPLCPFFSFYISGLCLRLAVSASLYRARPCSVFV